ncbi:MAG: DUF5067 domain-containing protein [Lachnospiraceae bacterium]|nr:DUF5067 domain-containing protein [Lachnospiraceae bacterium]
MNQYSDSRPETPALNRHEKRRAQKRRVTSIVLIVLEVIVLIGVIVVFFHFYTKLKKGDFATDEPSKKTEQAKDSPASGTVNVDNDKFALTCRKVQIVRDVDGKPAALIYFSFTNKTKEPLSMSDVFPPFVKQGDADCETFATLENAPDELYNRDLQISDGQTVECCYAVKLYDTVSTITLTIHDNYDTFTDIGSVDIPLQSSAPEEAQ